MNQPISQAPAERYREYAAPTELGNMRMIDLQICRAAGASSCRNLRLDILKSDDALRFSVLPLFREFNRGDHNRSSGNNTAITLTDTFSPFRRQGCRYGCGQEIGI